MSSEAAAYFPDTLSSASPAREPEHIVSGRSSDDLDRTHSQGVAPECSSDAITLIAELSDETLLEQVSQGNKEALGLLFRRHARSVRNVARGILRDDAEADDLVQEVFLFVFRKAALFSAEHCTARSWIIQATYHRAFDRRRYLNTRHFDVSRGLEDAALMVIEHRNEDLFSGRSLEDIWGRESAARLRELLSPAQLSTIELYFFEGYTLEEIAERLGQTVTNVRHHYYRGLEKLRRPAFAGKLRPR